ncbi:phage tail tape measure protein [Paenibacillus ehimensis]|uniref:phage tail tape measure protein n=1 Tax=Paenibacillus ehimensis TaxID=79264 RepID=UPI000FD7261D|nr:phage tail tape measure protein [Paenibacillus ehimensis]
MFELKAKISLIDMLTAPMRKVERQVKSTERATRMYSDATTKLSDSQGKLARSAGQSSKQVEDVNQRLSKMSSSAGTWVGRIGKTAAAFSALGVAAAGVAAGGLAFGGLKRAMDYEAQLSSIQALTGASAEEMKLMNALALEMGAKTKYSALQAAQGIEELLKAGIEPATVKAGGLEAALNLATAGGLDLAEAAETMATSLNAFKKDGLSASDASNILAGTANTAATDVRGLGFALASVGGVADMIGLSFRDVNTAIGLMSNDGLKNGSDAGTSFKSMLMYLQPQTEKATELFNKLGIGVGKANKFFKNGKIKDLAGISEVLQETFKNMSEQQRTATFLDIFGTDGVKAASTLYKAGADGVKKFRKEMSEVTALEVAKKKMDNAAGAVEQFKGAVETLQISALTPVLPIIKKIALAAVGFVEKYTPKITAAVERMVSKAKEYVKDRFINNPAFQNLTAEGKIRFVIDDILSSFSGWLKGEGGAQIKSVTETLVSTLAAGVEAASQPLVSTALSLGKALANGVIEGLQNALADHPLYAAIAGGAAGSRFGIYGVVAGAGAGVIASQGASIKVERKNYEKIVKDPNSIMNRVTGGQSAGPLMSGGAEKPAGIDPFKPFGNVQIGGLDADALTNVPGHSGGLDRVPYDGYVARLHKDERVQTRTEANEYRSGRSSTQPNTVNVTFNYNGTGNAAADVQEMMRLMVRELEALR